MKGENRGVSTLPSSGKLDQLLKEGCECDLKRFRRSWKIYQSSTADTSSSAEQGHPKDNENVSVDIPLNVVMELKDSTPVIDQDQGSSFSNSQSNFRATTAQP